MNRVLLGLVLLMGVSGSVLGTLTDSLDNASGSYTYNRQVYSSYDAGAAGRVISFDTTGGKTTDADLLDNAGYLDNSDLVGMKSTPGYSKTASVSNYPDGTITITFALDAPVPITQLYIQGENTLSWDPYSLPIAKADFQYSDDNGATWNDLGSADAVTSSQYWYTKYCVLDLPQQITKKDIRIIAYSPAGYNTYLDEVEFRVPEPLTLILMGAGGMGLLRRRK